MGQQGKFLLNKASFSMPWKFNITNLNDQKNLFFKSKMLTYIFEFLLKYSIYLKFLKIKNKKFKKFKNNSIFLKNRQKTTKKTAKKIYLSQLLITYCNSWFIFKICIYILTRRKKKIIKKTEESFFRIRHQYYYLTPDLNKF